MSGIHGKFIWCELMTTNMQGAENFYTSIIGWKTKRMPMPGEYGAEYGIFDTRAGEYDCGVAGYMKIPAEMAGNVPPIWTGYVAVDNVDEIAERFEREGGSVLKHPSDIPDVGRFAVVADPHGAVLCLMTPTPRDEVSPMAPVGSVGTFGWHELLANDGEEALAFYSKIFGWTLDHAIDMGDMGKYLIFAHQGQAVGGMMSRPPQVPVPHWGYYVIVPSVGNLVEKIKAQGGQVIFGPQEVPGGSFIVNAVDPQGAHFSLVSSAP